MRYLRIAPTGFSGGRNLSRLWARPRYDQAWRVTVELQSQMKPNNRSHVARRLWRTVYYEAGHALADFIFCFCIRRVSIVPLVVTAMKDL